VARLRHTAPRPDFSTISHGWGGEQWPGVQRPL